jgi:hypothetical protein
MKRALILLLLAACGSKSATETTTPQTNPPVDQTASESGEIRFEGTITEVDFGCAVDAMCHVTIDGTKHVRFGHDTRGAEPADWGNSDSLMALMEDPTKGVGKKVSVYAATDGEPEHFTLKGKAEYYVTVID